MILRMEPGDIIIDNDKDSIKITNKISPIKKLSRLEIIDIIKMKKQKSKIKNVLLIISLILSLIINGFYYKKTQNDEKIINELLGSSGSIPAKNLKIEGDINKKYTERLKIIEYQTKIQYYTNQKLKAQDKIKDLKAEFDDYAESNKSLVGGLWHGFQNTFGEDKAKQISNEMLQQFIISNDADANITSLNKQGVFIDSGEGNGINTNTNNNNIK